jgi:hypothetical protein
VKIGVALVYRDAGHDPEWTGFPTASAPSRLVCSGDAAPDDLGGLLAKDFP